MREKVASRYIQAMEDQQALDSLVDSTLDRFLSELEIHDLFDEKHVSHFLEAQGLTADELSEQVPAKEAGPLVKALGGVLRQGLWYLLVRPFKMLSKVVRSSQFRSQLKGIFYKALKRDMRATKHLLSVAGRLARGEEVSAPEKKAAAKYLVELVGKAVLIYFTGPQVLSAFSGPVWAVVSKLVAPVSEILYLLLVNPISAVSRRLLTDDLSVR